MSTLSDSFQQLQISAPAKINLFLKVKGRREDGFHEIETLMVRLALQDEITLKVALVSDTEPLPQIELVCDDPSLPTDQSNLAYRAASLFLERVRKPLSVKIDLRKYIPHGAGLAGGSSDAAAVLLGLNQLVATLIRDNQQLSQSELMEIAAALGSDIPFFLFQSAAICRGRGEIVEPYSFSKTLPIVLFKPPFGIPTPWAYSQWAKSQPVPGIHYEEQTFDWGMLVNDLERPVFGKYLYLAALKNWLLEQPEVEGALMSGSGSTIFAVLKAKSKNDNIVSQLATQLVTKTKANFGEDLWHLYTTTRC